jgi:hypothetical protein
MCAKVKKILLIIGNVLVTSIFKKKVLLKISNTSLHELNTHYFLGLGSEETVSLFLPLARLLAKTLRPLAEAILSLNPCLFLLFLFDG